jgi:DNA-binding response OmpR family regulator/anti-sigma regulatory factor (Ser/Thr protein kinase)
VGGNERIEIYGDNEKIEIALFNLLSNAFKFTPDRGTILFQIREEAEDVEILIKDSGCGIPAGTGNSIFEKFRRGAVRQEQQPTGFGIGLYLVKHFIDSHQGNISYHSQLNEGTTFVIRLKKGAKHLSDYDFTENASVKSTFLEELTVEPLSTGRTTEKKEKKGPEELITEKRSILLIDDNIEIRNYVRQLFQDDFLIYEADNGDEGFASVQQFMPDLVISDVQMQGMDGVELCTRIKQTEDLSHIPVILLTATPDLHIKGIAGGADDYITKPFDKDLLLAKVHTIIKNRNLLQQYFLNSITLQKSDIKVPAEYRDFLKKCIEIVEANLGNEDFSIKTFTIAIGMSHSSLYKKVKSISGQTVNAFIRSIRLRRAAVLMLKENYTISQAAFQVGIGDVKYFREQFFKLFGMNPSDYVRKYRHSFNQELNVSKEQG